MKEMTFSFAVVPFRLLLVLNFRAVQLLFCDLRLTNGEQQNHLHCALLSLEIWATLYLFFLQRS